MSDWILATRESGFTRHFDERALPVSIGGGGQNDIELADVSGSVQIGRLDDVFFVQPGRATENVRLDGELLRGSKRIADGSVLALDTARLTCRLSGRQLTLEIEAQVTAGDTAPPDFDALAEEKADAVAVSPISFKPQAARAGAGPSVRVSRAALAVYAAFVVLATLGWFAFTAKSVRIELDPPSEIVDLPDTWFKFRLGDRYLLKPGEHRITAELEGYYPLDETVNVSTSSDQTVALEFVRLPGLISFATEPAVAAEIRIDGEVVGTTPISDYEVRPGTHQIQFTAERFLTELETLEVAGGHERQTLTARLTPSWAPVTVSSVPAGAEILVDGRVLGATPAELELTAGERTIELALPGYNGWSRRVQVVADEPQTLPEVTLSLADGRIALSSEPADAVINVNGEYLGRTPRELRLLPNAEHEISVQKPGYETETLVLTLAPGARRTVDLELVPRLGIVEVTSEPAGASVFVDGEARGTTPLSLELMTVEHAIVVELAGYASAESAVTPRPGYAQTVPFRMERLDQSTGGGYPRVIETTAGQRLRLIPAGRFQMGSSRSDPERRNNEVLREVELTRAFYLAETEMTNGQYRAVCDPDHDSGSYEGHSLNGDDQPVVNVDVQDIFACLNVLSIRDGLQPVYDEANGVLAPSRAGRSGYRLPTEAEFAWAMRYAGRDGTAPTRYSWGDELPPPDRVENLADLTARSLLPTTLIFYTDGYDVSAPVGSFGPNAAGLYDMGGNVAEWVQDFYDSLASPGAEVEVDPLGPATGRLHVIRGPSWRSATETQLRQTYRDYDDDAREDVGFRIARNLD